MIILDCEFLVVGSGLAGLVSALHLSRIGKVVLATKKSPEESNTSWAQGGIACVADPDDTIEEHVHDTISVGAGLCKEDVVRTIVSDGPAAVRELEDLGVVFERREGQGDEYDLGREGGHSRRRVLHSGDITGAEITKALLARVAENSNIELLTNSMAIDLISTGWLKLRGQSRCVGAYFQNRETREIFAVRAPHTILATGGAGKVYLYTSNPDVATGDGIAMAWRAGLAVRNLEMVQFHPTCLYHPEAKSFLISEAVRGEGAVLVNYAGESFMERYDRRGSLAPRDVVARAIDNEMKTSGARCVFLDITRRSSRFLRKRFPNIYARCLKYGFHMDRDPIPVVPAAHYFCGGVEAAVDGSTEMPGLFACGEVTCTGLHGANRLASNSLLEAIVCARRMAERIAGEQQLSDVSDIGIPPWRSGDAVPSDEAVVVEHNWNEVRTCMWDYVGIVRTDKRLDRAMRRIRNLRAEIRQYYLAYLVTPDVLELRNIADVAELVIRSARNRKESRGLHYTLDYPRMGDPGDTRIVDPPGGSVGPA